MIRLGRITVKTAINSSEKYYGKLCDDFKNILIMVFLNVPKVAAVVHTFIFKMLLGTPVMNRCRMLTVSFCFFMILNFLQHLLLFVL